MLFADKIASIWDEVSNAADSDARNSLFRIQGASYSSGAFGTGDTQDWYWLDLPNGTYTLYVTTEGLNPDDVSNGDFRIDIVDSAGEVVLGEDMFHPDTFTDQIAFNYQGGIGEFYLQVTALTESGFSYQAAVIDETPTEIPPPTDWRLFAGSGFLGEVGGSGQIAGTTGSEEIYIFDLPGNIVLDPSFNAGGDIVHLVGDAAQWFVRQSASSVVLFDGDSFVQIPIGTAGITIAFDDGTRTLAFDQVASAILFGDQEVGADFSQIVAPVEAILTPVVPEAQGQGKLFVAAGGLAVIGGNVTVSGTAAGAEVVGMTYGSITFDPSFNVGGDILAIGDDAAAFTVRSSASSAVFESDYLTATVPVGTGGLEMDFTDASGDLVYDAGLPGIFLGAQLVSAVAAPVAFA